MALEGLSSWSAVLPTNSTLSVRVASGVVSKTVAITSANKLPEVIKLPVGDVSITVDGKSLKSFIRENLYSWYIKQRYFVCVMKEKIIYCTNKLIQVSWESVNVYMYINQI